MLDVAHRHVCLQSKAQSTPDLYSQSSSSTNEAEAAHHPINMPLLCP